MKNQYSKLSFVLYHSTAEIGSRLARDIPGVDISTLEHIVFGNSKQTIVEQKSVVSFDVDNFSMILPVLIGDYKYFLDGVWSPTSCRPRWKVREDNAE